MTTWIQKLLPYKEMLDLGTNEGLRYNDESKSRYQSIKRCMEIIANIPNPRILELGTCRSYVDGKFEGCNSDDTKYWDPTDPSKWDWGAGMFSVLMHLCMPPDAKIESLDLIPSHLKRCMHMHATLPGIDAPNFIESSELNASLIYGTTHKISFTKSDSVAFLRNTKIKYNFIYLDTGDMWPIGPTCELQLSEAAAIIENNVLSPGGILLIDDVLNGTPREQGDILNQYGKSELSLPYLQDQGFKIIFEGYQYILQKE